MHKSIDTSKHHAEARARHFVSAALRALLKFGRQPSLAQIGSLSEIESGLVLSIAKRNKIAGLIGRGARNAGLSISGELAKSLAEEQSVAIAKNLNNLQETNTVCELLRQKGVPFAVMKGPLRTYQVFSGLDARSSNDIDVLVRRTDYRVAGQILCNEGYKRGVPIDDSWWHDHLGESPFLPLQSRCIVDIHHKVQQPGGPAPADIGAFLTLAEEISVANRKYTVLHSHSALLLAYISASKAQRSGEPWLAYAAEIALAKDCMGNDEKAEFFKYAHFQKLDALLAQVDSVIDRIFDGARLSVDQAPGDDQSVRLAINAFGGLICEQQRFHRSRLLWEWTKGAGSQRMLRFAQLSAQRMISDLCRPKPGRRWA